MWLTGFLTWAATAQGANYLFLVLALAAAAGLDMRLVALATALIYLTALCH